MKRRSRRRARRLVRVPFWWFAAGMVILAAYQIGKARGRSDE